MVMMAIFSCDSGALALVEEIGIRVGLGLGQGELVRQRGDTEAMALEVGSGQVCVFRIKNRVGIGGDTNEWLGERAAVVDQRWLTT